MESTLLQDTLGLGNLKRDNIKFEHAIEHTNFDLELYEDIKALSPMVTKTVTEGENILKTFGNLSEDFFMSLYKFNPKVRPETDMLPSRGFNYGLLTELQQTPEYEKLRGLCSLNLLNSAIGTEALHNSAISKINIIVEDYKRKLKQAKANNVPKDELPQNIIDAINKMAEFENNNAQKIDDPDDPNDPFGLTPKIAGGAGGNTLEEAAAKKLANMQEKIEANQQIQRAKQEAMKQIQEALKQSAQAALDDVQEMDEFIQAWGLESSSENRVPIDECKRALDRIRNSRRLREFSKILGRFRHIAQNNLKKKSKENGIALKNVEIGSDVSKLLPSEKALLNNEATKTLFRKKFNERQLLQYQTESVKRKGMGPIIVCMDKSGSMDGDKINWAKAVALALLEVALKQRRNYYFMSFTTTVGDEYEILKGCANPNTIIDIASIGDGGGTTFNAPVNKAMEIINKSPEFRKADICFITDGDCDLPISTQKRLKDLKERRNIKIQTVVIDAGGHCSKKGVKEWSDSIVTVSDLAELNDSLASDLFNFTIQDEDNGNNS